MKTIELSDEEANVLIQLIDIAVKSAGLNVAQAATVLVDKIGRESNPPTEVEASPQFAEASIEPPSEENSEE